MTHGPRSSIALSGLLLGLGALVACPSPSVKGPPTPPEETQPVDTGETGDTQDTGETGDTQDTDTNPEVFDCSTVPAKPEPESIIEGAFGSKGLAFDDEGHIVGTDGTSLIKASYEGDWEVWIPGVRQVEGLAYLSGGDLISTYGYGSGEVKRYSPEGGQTVLVGGLANYSVIIAPNDMIYAAGWNGAFIIHPDTGEYSQLFRNGAPDFPNGVSARTLAFSEDYDRLFIGTIDNQGRVYVVDLDEDYLPTGTPEVFAQGLGNGWHDGLGIDICGNVYAVDYNSTSLYRASADGSEVTRLVSWADNRRELAHGLIFGTGDHGWRIDALYLPESENGNRVKEIVVGVPGNRWEGEVVNGP
jgi:sugar lactone lactonase YvrE